mgnify:CR=1 FL=1
MCLSTVFEETAGERKMVCEYVSGISTDETSVTLTDIMGKETVIKKTLKSIQFKKSLNILKVKKPISIPKLFHFNN